MNLTVERLKERLTYDPDTGIFQWRTKHPGCSSTRTVGTVREDGYRTIKIDGSLYYAQRLAWLYMHGAWPDEHIDHRDRNRDNNRIKNLRPCTLGENNQNQSFPKTNTSGYPGVIQNKKSGRWHARISVGNRSKHVGSFATLEDAIRARAAAKARHHEFHPVDNLPTAITD